MLTQLKDHRKLVTVVLVFFNSLKSVSLFMIIQEYSEDSASEPDVDLENQYYNSKALKEDDPKAALENFQKVFALAGYKLQLCVSKLLLQISCDLS